MLFTKNYNIFLSLCFILAADKTLELIIHNFMFAAKTTDLKGVLERDLHRTKLTTWDLSYNPTMTTVSLGKIKSPPSVHTMVVRWCVLCLLQYFLLLYVLVSTFISGPTVFQPNVGIWWLKCGLYSHFIHTSTHIMLWYIGILLILINCSDCRKRILLLQWKWTKLWLESAVHYARPVFSANRGWEGWSSSSAGRVRYSYMLSVWSKMRTKGEFNISLQQWL